MRPVSTARAVAILGASAERPAIHDMAHPLLARSRRSAPVTLATPGRRRASGALASAPETALLYNPTDINRLYFGTDTHAQSVLVGATLALGLRLWAERNRKGAEGDWPARTVESQLQKAVHIATAGGARMVLMTKPCRSTGEQPDAVQDLNAYVCPGGQYTEDLDSVPIRESDVSHFDRQPGGGGDYLAPAILPYWIELGHLQEAGTNGAGIPRRKLPRFFAAQ